MSARRRAEDPELLATIRRVVREELGLARREREEQAKKPSDAARAHARAAARRLGLKVNRP